MNALTIPVTAAAAASQIRNTPGMKISASASSAAKLSQTYSGSLLIRSSIVRVPSAYSNGPFLLGVAGGAGGANVSVAPSASLARAPMTPNVAISCVASTGNRIVLALGDVANFSTALT